MDTTVAISAIAFCIGLPLITAAIALISDRYHPTFAAKVVADDSVAKAWRITALIWLVLTAIGLYLVLTVDFYPVVASDKGEEIAKAFRVLTALAVPVFAGVVAVVAYSVLRRGTSVEPEIDGPAFEGRGMFPNVWLALTAGLTVLVIIYPGITTLDKVTKTSSKPDLVVNVEGLQWTWLVSYPDQGIENRPEIVIPVNRTVNFMVTSKDVIHSFWVPAMLMKEDAVPGRTTIVSFKATKTGDSSTTPQMRLQCAELCGLGHASMHIPFSVVTQSEFDAWVQKTKRPTP